MRQICCGRIFIGACIARPFACLLKFCRRAVLTRGEFFRYVEIFIEAQVRFYLLLFGVLRLAYIAVLSVAEEYLSGAAVHPRPLFGVQKQK